MKKKEPKPKPEKQSLNDGLLTVERAGNEGIERAIESRRKQEDARIT